MPIAEFAADAALNARPFGISPVEATRCGCPLCAGMAADSGATTEGASYLNASERAGAVVNGKQSFTIDRAGLQLTGFDPVTMAPYPGWGGVAGQAYTVTYAYRAAAPVNMPSDTEGFQRFNAAQIVQAELAILAWSDVANIRFIRIGSGTEGDQAYSNEASILLGNYTSGEQGSSAFANYPGNPSPFSAAGDVWVNITAGSNAFPSSSNFGGQVLVHELGHAIGLAHPGDYNADGDTRFTYAEDAEYYQDSRQYTVMSYFSETNTGANFGGRFSSVPLLDDIRGAQIEYGANMSTRTGDTIYGFNSNSGRDWFLATSSSTRLIFAVWDAGGNDTFDFSGYSQNQTIDLREGHFSDVGALIGNVAIAQGARIENAIGGFGADTITGNAQSNALQGNGGADRILAGAGDDTLDGGAGSNFLRGEDGNDSLAGGSVFDDIHGNAGDDTASGGLGDDWVVGGKDNDILYGNEGGDLVLGNLGDDTLVGGVGDDIVRGGQGNDSLVGDAGVDFLSGDRGDDTISGGQGADTFNAFEGSGLDRILDFSAGEGDRVMLAAGTTFTTAQSGADTVVTIGTGGDRIVLVGVQVSSLPEGWIFNA